MSQVARVGAVGGAGPQILRLGDDRASISGTIAEVNRVVGELRRRGQLARVSDPQPNGTPGGVLVTVRVLPAEVVLPSPEPKRRMRWTRNWVLAAVAAGLTVLTMCGLAVRAAFLWVAAHGAAIGTAGVVVVGVVIATVVANLLSGGRIIEGTFRGRIR